MTRGFNTKLHNLPSQLIALLRNTSYTKLTIREGHGLVCKLSRATSYNIPGSIPLQRTSILRKRANTNVAYSPYVISPNATNPKSQGP